MLERMIKPTDKVQEKTDVLENEYEEEKKAEILSFPLKNGRMPPVKERMIDNSYSFSGDGNGDDSIGDTLHVEGPLSLKEQSYLRMEVQSYKKLMYLYKEQKKMEIRN